MEYWKSFGAGCLNGLFALIIFIGLIELLGCIGGKNSFNTLLLSSGFALFAAIIILCCGLAGLLLHALHQLEQWLSAGRVKRG